MKSEFDILNDVTVDFSAYEVKELNEKELNAMKDVIKTPKKKVWARIGAIAACVGLVAALSQTAFAKEFIDNVVKKLSTGHNNFYQVDFSDAEVELPEALQIFYDENGKLITTYREGHTVFYDKDGNKIDDVKGYVRSQIEAGVIENEDGTRIKINFSDAPTVERYRDSGYTVIENEADMTVLDEALDFTPVMPGKLPEGFSFLGAAYFDTSGYYLTLIYANGDGDEIYVSERLINEETAFETGSNEKIEEIEISGHKAVLTGDHSIDWESDGVAVGINAHGISREALIAMAESME